MENKSLRKSIIKDAWKRIKEYFWIYFAVIIILEAAIAFSDGSIMIFSQIQRLIQALKNGIITKASIMSPDSSLWQMITISDTGFIGIIILYFIANPLSVGVKRLFMESMRSKPRIDAVLYPFKNNYRNIFFTTFLSNLLLSFLLVLIMMLWGSVLSIPLAYINAYDLRLIFLSALMIIISALFFILIMSVRYNFSMIFYILAEHPEYNFTLAYALSRKIVKGNKWFIFKTEFVPFFAKTVITSVPIIISIIGISMIILEVGGRAVTLIGLMSIIPMYFFSLFFTIYENSIWIGIYEELKKGIIPEIINEQSFE